MEIRTLGPLEVIENGRPISLRVPQVEALVRSQPLRERLRAQLVRALYRAGRQADALAVYQDVRKTLIQQMGSNRVRSCRTSTRRSSIRTQHLRRSSPSNRRRCAPSGA